MTPLDVHRLLVQLPPAYGAAQVRIGQHGAIGQLLFDEPSGFTIALDLIAVGWPHPVFLAFSPVHRAVATQDVGLLVAHADEVIEDRRRRRQPQHLP